jgi:hypothetical protein
VRSRDDVQSLAGQVGALFLYGFLERASESSPTRAEIAGGHDDA